MGNNHSELILAEQFAKSASVSATVEQLDVKQFDPANFDVFQELGRGAFAQVRLVMCKNPSAWIALKILDKKKIVERKQVVHVNAERKILSKISSPFCIDLYFAFQSGDKLMLGLEYVCGGEMYRLLRSKERFKEGQAKFYAAQVMLALQYMHNMDIIYRDLKPENILINKNGYLKIADFGFAKVVLTRTYTMCGTPEYISPEILKYKGYGKSVDWWAFGILLYEMVMGFSPFYAEKVTDIYENILEGKIRYPKRINISNELKDLIRNTVEPDITRRYGCMKNRELDIKMHPWFVNTNWGALMNHKVTAPYLVRKTTPKKADKKDVEDIFMQKETGISYELFPSFAHK